VKRFLFLAMALAALNTSCSDDQLYFPSTEEYYPLSVGVYQVYDVEEIRYSAFAPPEVNNYQLRHEIVDFFENGEGAKSYVIHRSTRQVDETNWTYLNTWSAYINGQYVVVQEENVKLVKLIAPMQVNNRWNGNKFNAFGEDLYTFKSIGNKFTVDQNRAFENTVVVNQSDERTLLFVDERKEVYGYGVGLAFKESTVIQFTTSGGLPGTQIIGGFYWKQILMEYGEH